MKKKKSKYTKSFVEGKIATSQNWLERAIIALYREQSDTEREYGITYESNNSGFNALDAKKLSYYAKKILKKATKRNIVDWNIVGRTLSQKDLALARVMMMKYSGQLSKMAQGAV